MTPTLFGATKKLSHNRIFWANQKMTEAVFHYNTEKGVFSCWDFAVSKNATEFITLKPALKRQVFASESRKRFEEGSLLAEYTAA